MHGSHGQRHGNSAIGYARHEYRGPGREDHVVYLAYYLERVRARWVIDRIDIHKRPFGSPKCFIATAAYGSPMESHVMVLREFRDRYLITNAPGRLFVSAYYRVSPPIARWIATRAWARSYVRMQLWPVIQLCRLLMA